jgi:hypothetical protein
MRDVAAQIGTSVRAARESLKQERERQRRDRDPAAGRSGSLGASRRSVDPVASAHDRTDT